ncbi:MAG: hemolysin family protein [Chloroflexota bacterium]
MSNDGLSSLLIIFVLLFLQAFISVAYAAIKNARTGPLRDQANDGSRRARQVLALISSSDTTVTYYTANTLLKFAIAAITVLGLGEALTVTMDTVDPTIVHTAVLFLIACLVIVLGDSVPEAVGTAYADTLIYGASSIMQNLVRVFRPLVLILLKISKLFSALARSGDLVNTVTEEEIMTLIDAGHSGGTIEEEEKDMIYSVLQLDQTHVSEMMVPRIDITAVEIDQSLEDAGRLFIDSGYSRIPVYEKNLDTIRGLLYAKDVLAHWYDRQSQTPQSIGALMRPVIFIPESKRADELLKELQQKKVHMAIVVDEYGGTAGLVTIEDIIEEIIGDIQDEYDLYEEEEYVQLSEHEYTVDASIDLDDFNDLLDVDLPTDESDTLGGYIYTHFGRVPLVDEVIENEHLHMRVQSVDGRRIRKVHVLRKYPLADDEASDDDRNPEPDEAEAGTPTD